MLLQQTSLTVHLCKLGADYSVKIRIAELENNVILGCLQCFVFQAGVEGCKWKLGKLESGLEAGAETAELGAGLQDPKQMILQIFRCHLHPMAMDSYFLPKVPNKR